MPWVPIPSGGPACSPVPFHHHSVPSRPQHLSALLGMSQGTVICLGLPPRNLQATEAEAPGALALTP